MTGPIRRRVLGASSGPRPALAVRLAIAVALLVLALALVPAFRDARGIDRADRMVTTDPVGALREAASSAGPATRSQVAAITVAALVRLGDLGRAERAAMADVAAHPSDPEAVRRLYQVQRLRFRRAAAARTLRALRRLDPKYANGTGL